LVDIYKKSSLKIERPQRDKNLSGAFINISAENPFHNPPNVQDQVVRLIKDGWEMTV
jgi:hypothetical protein